MRLLKPHGKFPSVRALVLQMYYDTDKNSNRLSNFISLTWSGVFFLILPWWTISVLWIVTILPLCYVLLEGMWDLSSPTTRDWTRSPCVGRWSLPPLNPLRKSCPVDFKRGLGTPHVKRAFSEFCLLRTVIRTLSPASVRVSLLPTLMSFMAQDPFLPWHEAEVPQGLALSQLGYIFTPGGRQELIIA